ncbi:quinone oxidoreductase PIG3-like [Babylonia areolata]|uniref:quinone oxidoreductase PIG3-like n=1 Tax=Babylonia areolata TaxID=304850 RepID=UPI003FD4E603
MVTFHLTVFAFCFFIVTARETMMKAAQIKEPGGPENLYLGQVPMPVPQPGEVLIKVKATAINRADTLQRKGLYPPPPGASPILGLEAAGVVVRLGPECSDRWSVGDRVMALLTGGGNAEYVACPEGQLMPVPSNLNFQQAAAIPEVWLTAFQLLHTIAKVQAGESVLIHGGASGVGTAATQLCLQAGAHPLVTAGTAAKLQAARGLGATAAFNYKEDDVAAGVLKATEGKGVNIVLDCVGGSMYDTNVNALAMDGRWIVYGLMGGGNINADLLRKVLSKRLTITGTTMRTRSLAYKRDLVENFSRLAVPLFEAGVFKPIIHTVLSLDDIGKAHQMMESNLNTGKIILSVNEEEEGSVKQEL